MHVRNINYAQNRNQILAYKNNTQKPNITNSNTNFSVETNQPQPQSVSFGNCKSRVEKTIKKVAAFMGFGRKSGVTKFEETIDGATSATRKYCNALGDGHDIEVLTTKLENGVKLETKITKEDGIVITSTSQKTKPKENVTVYTRNKHSKSPYGDVTTEVESKKVTYDTSTNNKIYEKTSETKTINSNDKGFYYNKTDETVKRNPEGQIIEKKENYKKLDKATSAHVNHVAETEYLFKRNDNGEIMDAQKRYSFISVKNYNGNPSGWREGLFIHISQKNSNAAPIDEKLLEDSELIFYAGHPEDLTNELNKISEQITNVSSKKDKSQLTNRLNKLKKFQSTLDKYEFKVKSSYRDEEAVIGQIDLLYYAEHSDTLKNDIEKLSNPIKKEKHEDIRENLVKKLDKLKNIENRLENNEISRSEYHSGIIDELLSRKKDSVKNPINLRKDIKISEDELLAIFEDGNPLISIRQKA